MSKKKEIYVFKSEAPRVQEHYHKHNSTVTEHRVPTDESVRLLQEMQQKALASILDSVKLSSNTLNGSAFIVSNNIAVFDRVLTVIVKFELNGEQYHISKPIEEDEISPGKNGGQMAALTVLVEKVGSAIALELLKKLDESGEVSKLLSL